MLIVPRSHEVKNPLWANITPNELYSDPELSLIHLSYDYRKVVDDWCAQKKVHAKKRWFEIRIINESTIAPVSQQHQWWKNKAFADRIFWVFQKPYSYSLGGHEAPIPFYHLEPYENLRVRDELFEQTGKRPFKSAWPNLLIPKDCVHLCMFGEMSAGYSDHLRHRPEPTVNQQLLDEQAKSQEEVDKLLSEVQEIKITDPDKQLGGLDE